MSEHRRLHVLRHAKAAPAAVDLNRPLAPEGVAAMEKLAAHIAGDAGFAAQIVLCSPARRAAQSLDPLRGALGDVEVRVEPVLYDGDADDIADGIRALPPEIATAMVVGHNPTLQELVIAMCEDPAPAGDRFPPGAMATIGWDGAWSDLARRSARLEGYVSARDL